MINSTIRMQQLISTWMINAVILIFLKFKLSFGKHWKGLGKVLYWHKCRNPAWYLHTCKHTCIHANTCWHASSPTVPVSHEVHSSVHSEDVLHLLHTTRGPSCRIPHQAHRHSSITGHILWRGSVQQEEEEQVELKATFPFLLMHYTHTMTS